MEENMKSLESLIFKIKELKNFAVKIQEYDFAADLRDREVKFMKKLEELHKK